MENKFFNNCRFVLWQCFIAAVIVVVLLIALYFWLGRQTQHGIEIEVPQITGLSIDEASILLKGNRLSLMVIDSTYSKKVPLGTIVDQSPVAQSTVKTGRTIYVVVNARQKKQVKVPSLTDISFRQAENMLLRQGLVLDSVEWEPSAYRDLVLDVRRHGESIEAGTMLTEGDSVVLVVGMGLGENKVKVPDLSGLTLTEARSLLLASHLIVGNAYLEEVEEESSDNTNDKEQVVYRQTPQAGNELQEGQSVNLWLTFDLERAATTDIESNEEDFF